MGGSRAQVNKPHKTRFASKSSRNLHKTSGSVCYSLHLLLFAGKLDITAMQCNGVYKLSVFGASDKSRIGKSEHNVAKGARAARVQRNKMVIDFKNLPLSRANIHFGYLTLNFTIL